MTTTREIEESQWFLTEHADSECGCSPTEPCWIAEFHYTRLAQAGVEVNPEFVLVGHDEQTRNFEAPRPKAGARAGNQFGTFEVKHATPAQVRYLSRLLAERDLTQVPPMRRTLIEMTTAQVVEGTVSKRLASDALDVLSGLPIRPEAVATASRASEKQVAFLLSLAAERGVVLAPSDVAHFTRDQASEAITNLLAQPKAPQAPQPKAPALESGIYRTDTGDIFKVYLNQGKDRMLAKRLHLGPPNEQGKYDAAFEYAGMAYRFVTPDQRMTLEEAKQFGAIYGVCCNCGATLTDENSIEAGIGPVCARRI